MFHNKLHFKEISPTEFERGPVSVRQVSGRWLATAPGCSATGPTKEAAIDLLKARAEACVAALSRTEVVLG